MNQPRIPAIVVGLRDEEKALETATELEQSILENEPDLPKDSWSVDVKAIQIYELTWAMNESVEPAAAKGIEALVQLHLQAITQRDVVKAAQEEQA